MNNEKFNWENERFRKDPFSVPEGYFADFEGRMMERINQSELITPLESRRIIKPWMAWASGIAAVLAIGLIGVSTLYWKPLQEERFQENIALLVDFYGEELHEGQLAGYFVDNNIELTKQNTTEVSDIIQMDPDLAEEYIYESVGF